MCQSGKFGAEGNKQPQHCGDSCDDPTITQVLKQDLESSPHFVLYCHFFELLFGPVTQ